jgi:hypothetical protein
MTPFIPTNFETLKTKFAKLFRSIAASGVDGLLDAQLTDLENRCTVLGSRVDPKPVQKNLLKTMENDVQRDGFCLITEERMTPLCPNALTADKRFLCIASLALKHGWSFEFPDRKTVRFATVS